MVTLLRDHAFLTRIQPVSIALAASKPLHRFTFREIMMGQNI